MNREQWLCDAVWLLSDRLGVALPALWRVSCGFPQGSRTATGQCWSPECSTGETTEMFISPALDCPLQVLATLLHEMIHAEVGLKEKHGKVFKQRALALGLTGRMATTVAGDDLRERLAAWASELGPYPHDSLQDKTKGGKKGETRMLKLKCPVCQYIVRTTKKWITRGLPTCVCGETFVLVEGKE